MSGPERRQPLVRPLHHVTLAVADLDASLAFYRDLLGMRVTMQVEIGDSLHEEYLRLPPGTTGRVAVCQIGPPVGAIQLIEWSSRDRTARPPKPSGIGPFLLAFEVEPGTLDAVSATMRDAGVPFWSEPVAVDVPDFGEIRTVVCEDPDGVMLELMELPTVRR